MRTAAGTHADANSHSNSDRECDPNGNAYFDANAESCSYTEISTDAGPAPLEIFAAAKIFRYRWIIDQL